MRLFLPSGACQNEKIKTRKRKRSRRNAWHTRRVVPVSGQTPFTGEGKIVTSAQLSFKTCCIFTLSFLGSSTHLFVLLGLPSQLFGFLQIQLRLISPGTGNAMPWVEHGAGKGSIPKRSWKIRAQLSATGLLDRAETSNGSGRHATPRPFSALLRRPVVIGRARPNPA